MMKLPALFAAAASIALLASPASARVLHETSVAHGSGSVAVSYRAVTKTSHKQTGLGPKSTASCLWSSEVVVERRVVDASGRAIDALTRTVGGSKADSGMALGYCKTIPERRMSAFSNDDKLRAFVVAAAESDAHKLRAEIASLDQVRAPAAS